MKKIILIATACAAYLSAYGLPTYEPFTEYAGQIAASPINLVVTYANGTPVGTNANASISNCLDLATGGYTAPGGELWGILNFSGTGSGNPPYASCHGLDIALVTNNNIFTSANLASLLPSTFPGFPASGGIAPIMENPAQPLLWYTTAQRLPRPTMWATARCSNLRRTSPGQPAGPRRFTCRISSILRRRANWAREIMGGIWASCQQPTWSKGPNLGPVAVALYKLGAMFNTFNGTGTNHYACHGLLADTVAYYIGACDSARAWNWRLDPFRRVV